MLTQKNKKVVVLASLILISFVLVIYAEDNSGIDPGKIKQSPFAQFTGDKQTPNIEPKDEPKPELFVETATLKFLSAKSLKASIGKMSSEYGDMEPDSKGNSLIICDTQENLAKILEQIRKIDRKPDQVMIEVVILDVKLNNETEIGINWDMLTNDYRDAAYRQNLSFSDRLRSTPGSVTSSGDTTDYVADATAFNTTGTGADFWLLSGDIRNVIHVLQEKNNVEILASPRVMVVSGQTASIEAIEEIPYRETTDTSQGGAGALTSTQFKNVGVKLNVGATLTDDKFILLDVGTEQNVQTGTSVVSGVTGTPIVDTRKIQSSLLLSDGQILVIGGLRRKETQKQTNQIPILGDLPIVGLAFKSTYTVENNSELLVILSPHIYKSERPADAEMQKFNEITQRPLLIIPEVVEKKQEEEKEKARQTKEAEKAKKAEEAREAKEAKKTAEAREVKEAKKAEEANKKAEEAKKKAEEANKKAEEAKKKAEEANKKAETAKNQKSE